MHRPMGRFAFGGTVPQVQRVRLRRPRIGLLGRSFRRRPGPLHARLLQPEARTAGAARPERLCHQRPLGGPGGAGSDRPAAPGDPAAGGLGRRRSGGRERPRGRGDEKHRPRGPEARRQRGQRLHRFEHLALVLFLPAGAALDDRRRLQTLRRALESDPRRVCRVRREVRLGSPSHRDCLRHRHGRAGDPAPWTAARSSASISIPATCCGRGSIRWNSSAPSRSGSSTST